MEDKPQNLNVNPLEVINGSPIIQQRSILGNPFNVGQGPGPGPKFIGARIGPYSSTNGQLWTKRLSLRPNWQSIRNSVTLCQQFYGH